MNRFEKFGFCPYNLVTTEIRSDGGDVYRTGCWNIFGHQTVCAKHENDRMHSENTVKMFGADPIGHNVMQEIIRRDPKVDMVLVHQLSSFDGPTLQELVAKTDINPVLILAKNSDFAVVVTTPTDLAAVDYGTGSGFWERSETYWQGGLLHYGGAYDDVRSITEVWILRL